MEKEITWNIDIKSTMKMDSQLDKNVLDKSLSSMTNPIHTNWNKERNDKIIKEYKDTVGEWQILKGIEIEKAFVDNLKITIGDDVIIESNYDMNVPIDWDKRDVSGWATNIHDIAKSYLFCKMEEMVKGSRADYEPYLNFIEELNRKQKINIHEKLD